MSKSLGFAKLFFVSSAGTANSQHAEPRSPSTPSPALPEHQQPRAPASPLKPGQAAPEGPQQSRRASAPVGDDDEMLGDTVAAAARRRERARCAAIVTCAAGLKNPDLAYGLAFETRMTRLEAVMLLELHGADSSEWSHLDADRLRLRSATFRSRSGDALH
jgi:hypothetical protein